jgi:hypothetical protein
MTLVLARSAGQLGNQLFLHAHVLACAMEHDLEVANPALGVYGRWLPAFARDPLCRWPRPSRSLPKAASDDRARRVVAALATRSLPVASRLPGVDAVTLADGEGLDLSDPAFVARARSARFMLLGGWLLRDPRSLAKHRAAVVAELAPGFGARSEADAAVEQARRRGAGALIGLHVRRGDYAGFDGGRFLYSLPQYRALAERALEAWGPGASLLICGDQRIDPEAFAGLPVTPGPGGVFADLTALGACDALIGPPSTFSGWASFAGGVPLLTISDPDGPIVREAFRVNVG